MPRTAPAILTAAVDPLPAHRGDTVRRGFYFRFTYSMGGCGGGEEGWSLRDHVRRTHATRDERGDDEAVTTPERRKTHKRHVRVQSEDKQNKKKNKKTEKKVQNTVRGATNRYRGRRYLL